MKGQTYGPVFLTAVYWSLCQAMNKSCRLPARCSVCVCGLCVSVCVCVCVYAAYCGILRLVTKALVTNLTGK